jgi:hypothetical protein
MTTFTIVLLILWLVVGFAALRFLGQRYFHEHRRADVAALAVVVGVLLGIALDPIRTLDRAAQPDVAASAPVAVAPAVEAPGAAASTGRKTTPAITALFRRAFVAWQSGTISPADYTARGFVASGVTIKTFSPVLHGLGSIRRVKFVSADDKDGFAGYEYRFDCANGSEFMGAYLDSADKIDSVGFVAVPAGG